MEVRPGYKQTEVGVIPEEWDPIAAECVVDPGAPICYGVVQVGQNTNNGVPIVAIKYVKQIAIAPLHRTSPKLEQPYTRSRVKGGDVLLSIKGTIGRVGVVPDGFEGNISRELARLRPRKEFLGKYLAHQLESQNTQARIARAVVGTTRLEFSIATLRQFQLPVPKSSSEQRAIASVLDDVDALLEGVDRLIAKKRNLKQAAMQQLLTGQIRLPGFSREWEETTLGQIGECVIGLTYKPENVVEHGLLVLRSSNVQNGRLAYDDNVHVNLQVAKHLYTQLGDILVCVRNGSRALIGKCAVIDSATVDVTFGAFMSVYRTKHWRFVLHAFQGDNIQRQIRDNIGATINQITNKDMKAFRIRLPPEDEQTAIAEVLTDMDAELAALEVRRDKTHALKQAMMQELLTGKTRLI